MLAAGPAAAYAHEGFDMFELMIQSIKEDTVKFCYNVTIQTNTARREVIKAGEGRKDEYHDDGRAEASPAGAMPAQAPKAIDNRKPATFKRTEEKIGRNDPCPCGSGKKYKNCCMGKDEE